MMRLMILMVLMVASVPLPALAATFCIGGVGMPLQCLYDDVEGCRRAEEPPNTFCAVNPDAVLSYYGGARYCTVSAFLQAECLYIDRAQCHSEALRRKMVCVDRETRLDEMNPYRFDNRIQN